MKLSSALDLRNAATPDVGVCVGQRRGGDTCSEDAALALVERGEARALYGIFGLTRQS
jgi:hypothetical protein